ncbi:MAG TPA: hypothetical protein DCL29_02020 [Eubacterium sp.]|nr:hypothetical protein [Eubacterium sp.]
MAHLLKVTEWQSSSGKWYVADTSDLAKDSSAWWHPARMLGISLTDYISLLINEYHADIDAWFPESNNGKSLLLFSWKSENYKYAHKYTLDINRIARNKNWSI